MMGFISNVSISYIIIMKSSFIKFVMIIVSDKNNLMINTFYHLLSEI